MESSDNREVLYIKHRPKLFKDVVGQPEAVKVLQDLLKRNALPHAILLSGPSGTGKTTLARILKEKVGCGDADFIEVNAANARGIDTARDISQQVGLAPIAGKSRVWLLDEVHQAMSAAQHALLKLLEDTPDHVYFFLCTTDPAKLLPTVRTRCTEIKLRSLNERDLAKVIADVVAKESGVSAEFFPDTVVEKIIDAADGSARKALVLLHQIKGLDADEAMECIQKTDAKRAAIDIARALINGDGWDKIRKIVKECDEEPESVRRLILAYASSVMLNGGGKVANRAYLILEAFSSPLYDVGKPGLVRSCWEVSSQK